MSNIIMVERIPDDEELEAFQEVLDYEERKAYLERLAYSFPQDADSINARKWLESQDRK